jgi:hypothetical protein
LGVRTSSKLSRSEPTDRIRPRRSTTRVGEPATFAEASGRVDSSASRRSDHATERRRRATTAEAPTREAEGPAYDNEARTPATLRGPNGISMDSV